MKDGAHDRLRGRIVTRLKDHGVSSSSTLRAGLQQLNANIAHSTPRQKETSKGAWLGQQIEWNSMKLALHDAQ